MVEPELGILMSTSLEPKMWILTRVRRNFGEPPNFHARQILLIHQIPKHSHAFNGGNTSFNQENRVGSITFILEVVVYKLLLDHFNLSPWSSRYIAAPYLTSYKITRVTRVSKGTCFLLQIQILVDLQLFSISQ